MTEFLIQSTLEYYELDQRIQREAALEQLETLRQLGKFIGDPETFLIDCERQARAKRGHVRIAGMIWVRWTL